MFKLFNFFFQLFVVHWIVLISGFRLRIVKLFLKWSDGVIQTLDLLFISLHLRLKFLELLRLCRIPFAYLGWNIISEKRIGVDIRWMHPVSFLITSLFVVVLLIGWGRLAWRALISNWGMNGFLFIKFIFQIFYLVFVCLLFELVGEVIDSIFDFMRALLNFILVKMVRDVLGEIFQNICFYFWSRWMQSLIRVWFPIKKSTALLDLFPPAK